MANMRVQLLIIFQLLILIRSQGRNNYLRFILSKHLQYFCSNYHPLFLQFLQLDVMLYQVKELVTVISQVLVLTGQILDYNVFHEDPTQLQSSHQKIIHCCIIQRHQDYTVGQDFMITILKTLSCGLMEAITLTEIGMLINLTTMQEFKTVH